MIVLGISSPACPFESPIIKQRTILTPDLSLGPFQNNKPFNHVILAFPTPSTEKVQRLPSLIFGALDRSLCFRGSPTLCLFFLLVFFLMAFSAARPKKIAILLNNVEMVHQLGWILYLLPQEDQSHFVHEARLMKEQILLPFANMSQTNCSVNRNATTENKTTYCKVNGNGISKAIVSPGRACFDLVHSKNEQIRRKFVCIVLERRRLHQYSAAGSYEHDKMTSLSPMILFSLLYHPLLAMKQNNKNALVWWRNTTASCWGAGYVHAGFSTRGLRHARTQGLQP